MGNPQRASDTKLVKFQPPASSLQRPPRLISYRCAFYAVERDEAKHELAALGEKACGSSNIAACFLKRVLYGLLLCEGHLFGVG